MKKVISVRYVLSITTTNYVFMLILVHYWPSSKDLIKKFLLVLAWSTSHQ